MGHAPLNWLGFYAALAAFLAPGVVTARALHGAAGALFLGAAGFVYSLGVFALLAWPCLWLNVTSETFMWLLPPWWAAFLLIASRFTREVKWSTADLSGEPDIGEDTTVHDTAAANAIAVGPRFWPLACAVWTAALASELAGRLSPWQPVPAGEVAATLTWCLIAFAVTWLLRNDVRTEDAIRREGPAPTLWTASAVGVALVLMAAAAWSGRPDWDDAWYLSAVHHYAEGGVLNRVCPALPDENFMPPHMRLLAWELWGAALCRVSGAHPMVSHHTLLPPVVVLFAFAIHWRLIARRLLSRRLAPLAILALGAYWACWVSSYDSPGSYLLTRAWQGKTALWSVALPLQVLTLWSFLESPSRRSWLAAALTSLGALAMSSSAVYLIFVLVVAFSAVQWIFGARRPSLRACAAACAVCLPEILYGLMVRSQLRGPLPLAERPLHAGWCQSASACIDYGCAELICCLLLPMLAVMLGRRARSYIVVLPCFLLATALNPLVYETVASRLTSYHTYFRLFWLMPVADALAAYAALAAVSAASVFRGRLTVIGGLAVMIGLMGGIAALPGRFAFSANNEGPYPGLCAAWGRNAYKIPSDLMPIIDFASHDLPPRPGRVLIPERLSPFFLAYCPQLHYVSSRPTYTMEALVANGRPEEGEERVRLAGLLGGNGTEYAAVRDYDVRLSATSAQRLLDKYAVTAVVTDRADAGLSARLAAGAFLPILAQGRYKLWRRPPPQISRGHSRERR